MSLFQAMFLGALQALAEFLPISSSGHLILVPALLGWPDQGLTLDVALHVGTAIALLAYFWRTWTRLGQAVIAGLTEAKARTLPEWRLAWLLVLGSIPGGVAGLLFEEQIEASLRDPVQVALLLIIFGLVLLAADRLGRQSRELDSLTWRDALVIGGAQALALAPGVSRSGITMTAALASGFRRVDSARFSFLLGTPLILAAGLLQLMKLARQGIPGGDAMVFLLGVGTSLVVGLAVIRWLLGYLTRHSVGIFVAYRVIAGTILLIYFSVLH
jgi:undecaprenyl-diphosphatase